MPLRAGTIKRTTVENPSGSCGIRIRNPIFGDRLQSISGLLRPWSVPLWLGLRHDQDGRKVGMMRPHMLGRQHTPALAEVPPKNGPCDRSCDARSIRGSSAWASRLASRSRLQPHSWSRRSWPGRGGRRSGHGWRRPRHCSAPGAARSLRPVLHNRIWRGIGQRNVFTSQIEEVFRLCSGCHSVSGCSACADGPV